jgi:hypothetical protein
MLGWSRQAWECVDPGGLLQEVPSEDCVGAKRYRRETPGINARGLFFSSRFALVALARRRLGSSAALGGGSGSGDRGCQPRSGDTTQNQY